MPNESPAPASPPVLASGRRALILGFCAFVLTLVLIAKVRHEREMDSAAPRRESISRKLDSRNEHGLDDDPRPHSAQP